MPVTNDPAARGASHLIVAESPVRAPLDHGIAWTRPGAPAVGSIPLGFDAQVRPITAAQRLAAGGPDAKI